MASTAAGTRLTQQQRRDQLSIRSRFLAEVLRVWPILDDRRLEQTAPVWLQLMLGLIRGYRTESARTAVRYYEQLRAVELPQEPPRRARLINLDELNEEPIRTSLIVTGPSTIKRQSRRAAALRPSEALESLAGSPSIPRQYRSEQIRKAALVQVSGAASRHVLDGGREALREEAALDTRVLAFARVSDGAPCSFCALMISRGYVYRTEASAGSSANDRFVGDGLYKFHDNCGCTVEPVFTRNPQPTVQMQEFERIYRESTQGLSGAKARVAFRRAIEGRATKGGTASQSVKPAADTAAARRAQLTAEIAALEKTFTVLQRRKDSGENVDRPYVYQRDRLDKLRAELRAL